MSSYRLRNDADQPPVLRQLPYPVRRRPNSGTLRYFFAATICFIQFLGYSVAQIDTLVPLPTIELSAPRLRVDHPAYAAWDSLELRWLPGANLADLLSQHSGAYVRSYGQGSLATLRVRGAAAEQSTVLWNGLPISSPALGMNDLALLPAFLIDEARLIPGGQSALWGSGAVGGSLQLNNAAPPSGHRLRLGAGLGSFGWQQQYLQYSFGTQKLQSSTRLLHQAARNDFPYKLGSEQRRQSHAETAQWLALQECYFRPDDRHQLVMRLWGQFTDRAIPPTTVQTRSGADQEDRFLRGSLHWTHQRRLGIWQARLGVFREHTFYSDTLTGETAPSDFLILQGEVEYQREFRRLGRFNFGSHWQNAQATTTGYSDGREQSRLAFFGNWRIHRLGWNGSVDLRQEWIGGRTSPLVPAAALTLFPRATWRVRLAVSRNYRWPTFNQLFWQPGGNADLRPERGWSQEALLSYWSPRLRGSLSVYHRRLTDGLLWRPDPNASYWSAFNLQTLRAYGLEQRLTYRVALQRWRLTLEQGYDFNRSYSEEDVALPRIEAGEQLIYTPQHQAFIGFSLQYIHWLTSYRHQYTGQVFGVNADLDAFHTGQFRLGYQASKWTTYLQLDNLLNAQYRVIERRPMPGRQWRIGLQWQFSPTQ